MTKKTSVYEMVTDRIIAELEKGRIPWNKPWMNVYGNRKMQGAFNRVTKKSYSVLNQMLLSQDGEYATFKQWQELGGRVKKGAKSEIVVFWKILTKEEETEDGDIKIKKVPILRYYNVFHISQIEGVDPLPKSGKIGNHEENSDAEADRIIADYVEREKIDFRETESDSAYYSPLEDKVVVPCREQYERKNEYYSTAFHELVHSTGSGKRLNRIDKRAAFGNEEYSKEELVAEIGAASILNMIGMEMPETFANSVAYIQSWIKVLRNDNHMIVSAGSRAEKAVEYMLGDYDGPEKEEPITEEESTESTEAETKVSASDTHEGKAKKSRREKPETVYKRIAKEAGKMPGKNFHKPSRFIVNGKEYLGFTEGHKIYATTKDYGFGEAERPVNMGAFFEDINSNMYKVILDRENVAALIRKNKEEKTKYPYIVEIQLDSRTRTLIGMNPKYALEAMDFSGDNGFYINMYAECIETHNHYIKPLYFINADGDFENIALVLPTNINATTHGIDQIGSYQPED